MKVKENQPSNFIAKVTKGLKISYEKLIQSKIEKNQSVVVKHKGKVITVKASELKNL